MDDDTLNSNFEWKKKGFGKREKLSRRIDAHQASLAETKKKNHITQPISLTAQSIPVFDNHLKKIKKRITQTLEEDDEEEDSYVSVMDPSLIDLENNYKENSLFNSLNDEEKLFISQKESLQQIRMQQDIAKIHALVTVNAFAKKAGLPQMTQQEMSENIQNNGWGKETMSRAIEQYIAPNLKLGTARLDPEKIKKLMNGLKRLQKIGGIYAVEGMKMNDVIHITDKRYNDDRVAKMLLRKTGRKANVIKDKKREQARHHQKISFKKLLQQRQQEKILTKV